MLRERGEKVSGRKSELVDRLLAGVEVVKVEDAFPVQDDPVDHPVDPVTPLEDDYFPVQDSAPEEDDLPVTEIPTLSPLSIKILRKSISRLRSRRSLPFTTFSSSPTSIDPGALTSLDEMLGENELVEAKAIMMGKGPVEVGDTVFQIAATLQVAIVEVRMLGHVGAGSELRKGERNRRVEHSPNTPSYPLRERATPQFFTAPPLMETGSSCSRATTRMGFSSRRRQSARGMGGGDPFMDNFEKIYD